MSRRILGGLTAALLAGGLALTTIPSGPVSASTEHCPDKDHPSKVESGKRDSVVLPAGTEFCAKGSTGITGKRIADGSTTLFEYLGEYVDNGGGNDPGVSYYIVYSTPVQEDPEAFVRVTPLCVGPGVYGDVTVPGGQYLMRVRHESGPGNLGYNLQEGATVVSGPHTIGVGETQYRLLAVGTNGVKAVPDGDWVNTYGGTGSTSQKPCEESPVTTEPPESEPPVTTTRPVPTSTDAPAAPIPEVVVALPPTQASTTSTPAAPPTVPAAGLPATGTDGAGVTALIALVVTSLGGAALLASRRRGVTG